MTLIASRDIVVERRGASPLSYTDIHLTERSRTMLLGDSGSGKTTLLSVLTGLLAPQRGSVTFMERDFYAVPGAERDRMRGRHIGFVFQTLHLVPSLTVRQNIALAADFSGAEVEKDRLEMLLHRLNLSGKAHRKPESLSQGEQQRAAIARAVYNKPSLIVADEPTSALDHANALAVVDLLTAQAEETGAALLIATHDERIAGRFSSVIQLQQQNKERTA